MGLKRARPRWQARIVALAGCVALLYAGEATAAIPEATDFEQAVGSVERAGLEARAATFRSRVLEAPARFDLAGLAGEKREAELRGRVEGGAWTAWTETANGDPVWFGGMDELQVRARGWTPTGRVHYVSVTQGPAEIAPRARESGAPEIVSRRRWGAKECKPRQRAEYGKVKAASVHHTVSAVDYSKSEARGMVLGICRFHRNGNGWNDIGYNALVDRFGNIYEGRAGGLANAVVGAHAQGFNSQTTGVAVLGTHASVPVSKQAMGGLSRWLAWKLPEHGIDGTGKARMVSGGGDTARYPAGKKITTPRIIGHRVTNFSDCPGRALTEQLPKLRRKVVRRIGGESSGGGGVG